VQAAERRERKFRIALALFAVLALLDWFTLGQGTILVLGRVVEVRVVPLFIIGTLVFRTVVARSADRIRQGQANDQGEQEIGKDSHS
jgi:hypothetical protein